MDLDFNCVLDENHKIFFGTKSGKGDIGETFCEFFLENKGLKVKNLNFPKRNTKGIDLEFTDNLGLYLNRGGLGVVQCRGSIRCPSSKHTDCRPQKDRFKISEEKSLNTKQVTNEKNASLFWSISALYPIDEDNTLLFFFFATDQFMKSFPETPYILLTNRIWSFQRKGANDDFFKGFVFKIYKIKTLDVLKLKSISDKNNLRDAKEFLKNMFIEEKESLNNIKEINGFDE